MEYVLPIGEIQNSIGRLQHSKLQEQFIFYLSILRLKANGINLEECGSSAYQDEMIPWLKVEGGGSYPYYRPFASRGSSYWVNPNLAGSFSQSSLRSAMLSLFYTDDKKLRLPSQSEVVQNLTKNKKVDAADLASYIFRNCSFATKKKNPTVADLIPLFKSYFGIRDGEGFDQIFDFDGGKESSTELERVADINDGSNEELTIASESYRQLDANDLGIAEASVPEKQEPAAEGMAGIMQAQGVSDDILEEIAETLDDYSGVILSGAPGTSKSYYARLAAELLTQGDASRTAFVQFHASYQFDDFMQGYRPNETTGSGFEKADGIFLRMCKQADKDKGRPYVMVIDELSRGDSQRIFGEALTYVEKTKRGLEFILPSGEPTNIPSNVYLIATMNPIDRGADDVDLAFGRRFGTIQMNPAPEKLREHLLDNELPEAVVGQLVGWLNNCNKRCRQAELPEVGHAFFWSVEDVSSLVRTWKHQVRPHLEKLFRFNSADRDATIAEFETILQTVSTKG